MKHLFNKATVGKDATRNERYSVLDRKNSILADNLTKIEAEAKLSEGRRLDRGWTEGGYRVFIGTTSVLLTNDYGDGPTWKVKAELWQPTYGLAVAVAEKLCSI